MLKIAFLFNQKPIGYDSNYASDQYAEWDNEETINAIADVLKKKGEVLKIDCHPEKISHIISELQNFKPTICFNYTEGLVGENREAHIPMLLELLNLKSTSSASSMVLAHHKARAKQIFQANGIATASYQVITSLNELKPNFPLPFPLIVKPMYEGSSKGIFENNVVNCFEDLQKKTKEILTDYNQPAIIETFLIGREFTVALIGNKGRINVLPIVEILFENLPRCSKKIYSYEAKWLWDDPKNPIEIFRCPANITDTLKKSIETVVVKSFYALDCKDWARVDIRLNENDEPYVIEINPLPGILPNMDEHSCFPLAARTYGMSFDDVILNVLQEALLRHHIHD